MAKDYKNSGRASARRKSAPGTPGPVWFLTGLALGLGAAVAVHAYHVQFAPRIAAPVATAPAAAEQAPEAPVADDRLRFEFYKLLPEMEVVVPEEEARELTTPAPEPPAQSSAAPKPAPAKERYLLQVASFQGHADADRLKAQLALIGLEASIQTVEIHGGQTWHRVRVGPFDRTEIAKVRERLQANGIDAVLLKLSG